jgi:hypothetical protein
LPPIRKKSNIKFGRNSIQLMAMSAPLDTEFLERRIGQLWVQATDHAKGSAEEQRLEKLAARLLDYVSDQPQMPLRSGDISPDWWPSEPNVVGRSGNQPVRPKGAKSKSTLRKGFPS